MRLFSGLLVSTLALGAIVTTGCAEHRYRGNDPYYGSGSYYGYNDPYYRQWLAERRYDNIEYNRLSRERQREYWEWRRQNEARFRQDPRFRDNQRVVRNDHDADDRRRNDHDADDRGRTYAQTRNGDRDRHQDDRDRHKVRDRDRDKHDKSKHDKDDH
ncbi:MAG: hypothetical protein JWM83_3, partial [Candidatus Angelobacter sp.]|nr:hypothetical protein [Candidatus Angelobacter sp.]